MDYWLFFTSDWSLESSVNNTKGDFHYKVDNILVKKKKKKKKTVIGVVFHRWVMLHCIVCIIEGVKLQKIEKGSTLRVHDGVHLILEVAPPQQKHWLLCSSQWMKGHKVWLKPKALWAYKQARWKTLLRNLLFQISSDFVTFETDFRDGFLNQSYVGLNLHLIRENQKIL